MTLVDGTEIRRAPSDNPTDPRGEAGTSSTDIVTAEPYQQKRRAMPRRKGISLRWRLISLVVAGGVPFLIFILGYQYADYLKDVDMTGQRTLALARSMSLLVDEELQSRISALQALAVSRSLEEGDLQAFRAKAVVVIAKQFPGANIVLLRQDGQQLINTLVPPGTPLPVRLDMETTRAVLASDQPAVSNLSEGAAGSSGPVVWIDVPAEGSDGKVVYLLSMNPRLDQFANVIRGPRFPATWLCGVFDRKGVTIARVPHGAEYIGQSASASTVGHLITEREGILEATSLEGTQVLTVFSRSERFGWVIAIGVPRAELTGPALEAAIRSLAGGSLLLGVSLVLALYAARGVAGPIESLRRFAATTDGITPLALVATGLPDVDEVAQALIDAAQDRRRRREAEAGLRDTIDTIPEGFVIYDDHDRVVMCNESYRQTFPGIVDQIVPGARFADMERANLATGNFPMPKDLEACWLADRDRELHDFGDGVEHLLADGRWILARSRLLSNGWIAGLRIDVTSHKVAEIALGKSEERLRLVLEGVPNAILAFNAEGIIELVNTHAELIFGYPRAELLGQQVEIVLAERFRADHPKTREAFFAAVKERPFGTGRELYGLKRDGQEFPIEIGVSPMETADGMKALVSIVDITERLRMAEVLRASEDRFRSIFSAVSEGIFILSATNGAFTEINEPGGLMFGYTADELIGSNLQALSTGVAPYTQQEAGERMEAAVISGRPQKFNWHCRAKDGHIFWVEISVRSALISGQKSVLAIMGDVTERLAVEAQLRQAQKMEAIGNLSGGMAHDFNNMLGVIISSLDMAAPLVSENANAAELVEEAISAALRGAELTRRLLAFARRQPLRPERIAPNDLVSGIVQLLRRTLGENIEIVLDLAEDLWPIIADPAQLEASLTNLATNARDAMPNGGRLSISTVNKSLDGDYADANVEVTAGDYTAIEVSDTGIGMAPQIAQHIFEPFYTTKEPGVGTGLGLSMVFGFIKQSGGHITVYSELGIGTTFRLFLPRAARGEANAAAKSRMTLLLRGAGQIVLAVEDDPRMRRVVIRQLSGLGYRPIEADGPAAALAILEREKIDLLFTDVVMPGPLDGIALARQVIGRWPMVKVVLTSGFTGSKYDEQFDSRGAVVRLLSKPYRAEDLAKMLRQVLDS